MPIAIERLRLRSGAHCDLSLGERRRGGEDSDSFDKVWQASRRGKTLSLKRNRIATTHAARLAISGRLPSSSPLGVNTC